MRPLLRQSFDNLDLVGLDVGLDYSLEAYFFLSFLSSGVFISQLDVKMLP